MANLVILKARPNTATIKARTVVDSVKRLLETLQGPGPSCNDDPLYQKVTSHLMGALDCSHKIIREQEFDE